MGIEKRAASGAWSHLDFRLYLLGETVSLLGTWVHLTAYGWLILQLTDSAFFLGLINFLNFFPMLVLAPLAGVMADRFDRRKLLIAVQAILTAFTFLFGLLLKLEAVTLPLVMVFAFLAGVLHTLYSPARQAYVCDLVGRKDLLGAISLTSFVFHGARIAGPALAGLLIHLVKMQGCFFINSASFLVALVTLLLLRGRHEPAARASRSMKEELLDGMRYVASSPVVKGLLLLAVCLGFFGTSYGVLLPVFARDLLHRDAAGFGFLMSAMGLGALLGSLLLALPERYSRKGRLLFIAQLVFPAATVLFALCRDYLLSLALLVSLGFFNVVQNTLSNTLLQQSAPDGMRGRVMSFYSQVMLGMMPLGALLAGYLATRVGVSVTLVAGAAVLALATSAIHGKVAAIRRL